MSESRPPADPLDTELAQLRAALRGVEAPPFDEAALRAAFREALRRGELQRRRAAAPPVRWAAAAGIATVAAAAAAAAWLGSRAPEPAAPPLAATPAAPMVVAAFQPLEYGPPLSPVSSYSVVRVRIPLASFALVPGTEQGGTIEAELLVGEDGLARGIRFIETDALLVSAQQ